MFSVTFQVLLLKKCSQYEKTFFRLCLLTKRGRKRKLPVLSKELPLGLPNTENEDLFEALRELRKRLADEEALPAYIVLSDKVLHLLSTSRPTTIEEFGNISGIGEYKKKKYGKDFVNLIRQFVE